MYDFALHTLNANFDSEEKGISVTARIRKFTALKEAEGSQSATRSPSLLRPTSELDEDGGDRENDPRDTGEEGRRVKEAATDDQRTA